MVIKNGGDQRNCRKRLEKEINKKRLKKSIRLVKKNIKTKIHKQT